MTAISRPLRRLAGTSAVLLAVLLAAPVAHAWHGHIVVTAKNVDGDTADAFAFTAKGPTGALLSGGSFSLRGGESKTFSNLAAGGEQGKDSWKRYVVAQAQAAGYDTAWSCTIDPVWDGAGKDDSIWAPLYDELEGQLRATVELRWWSNKAYTTRCEATNTKRIPTTLTVIKDFVGAPPEARADLRIDGVVRRAQAGDGESTGAVDVGPGPHTFSETAQLGTILTGSSEATCVDADGRPVAITPAGPRAWGLELARGAAVTCTIINRQTARITIVKETDPIPVPGDPFAPAFTFQGPGGRFSLGHGQSHVLEVDPGIHMVSEDPRDGSTLRAISCSDQAAVLGASTVDLAARTARIDAGAGEEVLCTFVNDVESDIATTSRPRTAAPIVLRPAGAVRGARLHGAAGCVDRTLTAEVRGRHVKRVRFLVDGRQVSYRHRLASGRYALRHPVAALPAGRHRLVAQVRFTRRSGLRPAVLAMSFRRCA
jgi:hypothetical protein